MEENQSVSDQTTTDSVTVEEEKVKSPEAVLAKNRQLLGEKKSLAGEIELLKRENDLFKQGQLEAEGKKDELIKSLREQSNGFRDELATTKKTYAFNQVTSNLKTHAVQSGCVDPDALVKLLNKDDFGSIEIDDKYSVNSEDANRVLDNQKKKYPWLFKTKDIKVSDAVPSKPNTKARTVKQMTKAEVAEALRSGSYN